LARVEALLRRAKRTSDQPGAAANDRVVRRQVLLDPERRSALVRGQRVELTKQEFDLLYQLASRPGIVFSRAALLQQVWNDDTYITERTVDAVISRLRRKIERDPQDSELILTAWGVGYKFADTE
jgi:DNA-binding response OmpR family regulator